MNKALLAAKSTQMDYDRMWKEQSDLETMDKVYEKVNRNPAGTQIGLLKTAAENAKRSRKRFDNTVLIGV